jgi:8-oxo-dGTP pyrophosphatase MutT (NUDIX family)
MSPFTLRRQAARVVLLDAQRRVFLMQAMDPADPAKPAWWEIPGGGVGRGETTAEAAKRELAEETGITDVDVGPCIWVAHEEFDFAGWHFDQHACIHVAWCAGGDYDPQELETLEAAAFMDGRWWDLDELLASDVPVLPPRLREFLPAIIAGELPLEPLDIGVGEDTRLAPEERSS